MGTLAQLEESTIELTPGEVVAVPLTVHNTGSIVEAYTIDVLGPASEWTDVTPPVIDGLYPQAAYTVTLTLRPPRSAAVPAGTHPFGVRVVPTEHPDEVVVPEATLQVLPFLATTAELTPRSTHGSRGAVHELAIDNRGNAPVTVRIESSTPQDTLQTTVPDPLVTVEAGHAQFATVKVRPVRRLWRGADVTHPFQVTATGDGTVPITLDGTHVQTATLPPWFGKAVLAALATAVGLVLAWFLLLRPTIESAAAAAVREEKEASQAAAEAAQAAQQAALAAAQQARDAASAADDSANDASGAAAAAQESGEQVQADVAAASGPGTPVREQLVVTATPPDGPTSEDLTVPEGMTLAIRDLILSNPQGDFGTLVVSQRTPGEDPEPILTFALENFRDLDYHFQSPIQIPAGSSLRMTVTCRQIGAPVAMPTPPTACSTSMYVGGAMVPVPATTASDGG